MPLYYFILKIDRNSYPDREGEEFDDIAGARAHAHAVAQEVMRNREVETTRWRLQVCDEHLEPVYECLFADVNPMAEFDDTTRGVIRRTARIAVTLRDEMQSVERTLQDLTQTMRLLNGFSQVKF